MVTNIITTQQNMRKEVPPGYRKTEVGVIPADWEVKALVEICPPRCLVRGPFGGLLKKELFVEHGFKVYEQRNAIYRSFRIGSYFVSQTKFGEMQRFKVEPGDFIISCSGTIGRIYQIPSDAPPGIINQALLKIQVDERVIFDKFFYLMFEWNRFQTRIIDSTQGGAMHNLVGMDVFKKTPVVTPPYPEQRAIAAALSDVDGLIETVDKLIAKKRAIKLATMQQLLAGKTRLPGFSEEWEVKTLGEIADILKGSGLSKGKLGPSGNNKCILYGELFTTYKQVIEHVVSRTNATEGRLSRYGDILMPGSTTTVGIDLATASALLEGDVLLGGDIIILRKRGDSYNPEFLAHYLTHIKKHAISELAQGITIIHLYGGNLTNLELRIPATIKEQDAIAAVLSDMDTEIAVLERRLEKTKAVKQGMMQVLLTGRVRLVNREASS